MKGKIEVILVDMGNTHIKYTEVVDGQFTRIQTHSNLTALIDTYPEGTPFFGCSTRADKSAPEQLSLIHHTTPLPIKLAYDTPDTLGLDRVAAAVGAYDLFPDTSTLIVDMGTCMTMDLVTAEGAFAGGIISPGLMMRMQSMSTFTANLPDISERWKQIELKTMGTSTDECLLAGSFGSILNEIKGTVQNLSQDFTSINVILTGGDAHHFESKLKAHIFAGSKIVLTGLYRIWKDLHAG